MEIGRCYGWDLAIGWLYLAISVRNLASALVIMAVPALIRPNAVPYINLAVSTLNSADRIDLTDLSAKLQKLVFTN